MPVISLIAAIGARRELGKDNQLLWHISADLKRFKMLTSGHPVIMGRKTFGSIGYKPLPNRKNIVLTRQSDLQGNGAILAKSVDQALGHTGQNEEVFILGGAQIYSLFLGRADKMYLTHVHASFEADTFFPEFDMNAWEITGRTDIDDDEQAGLRYSFVDYRKKAGFL